MKGIFSKSSKNPVELVRSMKDDLNTLEKGGDGKKQEKARTDKMFFFLPPDHVNSFYSRPKRTSPSS